MFLERTDVLTSHVGVDFCITLFSNLLEKYNIDFFDLPVDIRAYIKYQAITVEYNIQLAFHDCLGLIIDNSDIYEEGFRHLVYIARINTRYFDSNKKIKNLLLAPEVIQIIMTLDIEIFGNFCEVLEYLINKMHLDKDERRFLQNSADQWWNYRARRKKITKNSKENMETDWFHPKIKNLLYEKFGDKVHYEVNKSRGKIDFEVYSIPIECKVFPKNMGYKSISGISLLKRHKLQAFAETMDTRIGFLIGYDYRSNINAKFLVESIGERLDIEILNQKIIFLMVFLGNMKSPSVLK